MDGLRNRNAKSPIVFFGASLGFCERVRHEADSPNGDAVFTVNKVGNFFFREKARFGANFPKPLGGNMATFGFHAMTTSKDGLPCVPPTDVAHLSNPGAPSQQWQSAGDIRRHQVFVRQDGRQRQSTAQSYSDMQPEVAAFRHSQNGT